MEAKHVNTTSN